MSHRSITCAVLVSQLVFLMLIAFGIPCAESCPDDQPDGRCAPACVSCACSPRPASEVGASVFVPSPTRRRAMVAAERLAPAQPEPEEILHVPKTPLA